MLNKIQKLIAVLSIIFHPKGGLRYIFKHGASIASFNINYALSNLAPDIQTIIDVGANIGQFGIASNIFFPDSQIYSFEPINSCFEELRKNTSNIANIHIYNFALGNHNEEIIFFQNSHTHASSALMVSDYQKKNAPKTKKYDKIKVQSHRLDDISFGSPLKKPILLKLDVQGYEKNVIEGAKKFLSQIDYILLETSFIEMYDNEPLFDEMHAYLKERGFRIVAPIGFLQSDSLIISQLDFLYVKENT